eukprot:7527539-Pyramimonas_sp.AAC.1
MCQRLIGDVAVHHVAEGRQGGQDRLPPAPTALVNRGILCPRAHLAQRAHDGGLDDGVHVPRVLLWRGPREDHQISCDNPLESS